MVKFEFIEIENNRRNIFSLDLGSLDSEVTTIELEWTEGALTSKL